MCKRLLGPNVDYSAVLYVDGGATLDNMYNTLLVFALCKGTCHMSEHGAHTGTGKPVYQRGNMLFTVSLYGHSKILLRHSHVTNFPTTEF